MVQGPVKTPHAQHTRNAAEVPTAFPGDCTPRLHTPALQVHLESRNLPAPLRAVSHQFGGGLDSSETPRHLERALGYSLSLSYLQTVFTAPGWLKETLNSALLKLV